MDDKELNVKKAVGKFGKVYYPLLALLAVLLLVFSFVTYYYVGASKSTDIDLTAAETRAEQLSFERNSYTLGTGSSAEEAATLISGWINGIDGVTEVQARRRDETVTKTSNTALDITADFATVDGKPAATFVQQDFADPTIDYVVDLDTVADMTGEDYAGQEGLIYAGRQVNNLIVVIPGKVTKNATSASGYGDAVLFMTHYDSDYSSDGGNGASAVAAMLGTIETVMESETEYENDLVFVITDGRYEQSVGAYAFKNQFVGFGNIYDRIGAAFNFDGLTSDGVLTIVGTSENDSGIMSRYLASSASVRTDSATDAIIQDNISSDFDIFYDKGTEVWQIPAINFMTACGSVDAGSSYDTYAKASSSDVIAQFASAMQALTEYFGNCDCGRDALGSSTSAASYTYLGLSGVASGEAVYTMSALLLVLLAVAVGLAVKFKSFGILNALKGIGGVALAAALSLAAFAAAYFILGSLAAAFGAITLRMLTTAHFVTPALVVPAIFFAAAVSCGMYPIIKRGFRIKAADCARGGAFLFIVLAVFFGFVLPAMSLPYLIIGLALVFTVILNILVKKPFKAKFGFGVERLFLYTIPMMFALPFAVQSIMMIGNLVATFSLIFLMLNVTLLLSSITPYFDYLQPVMTDVFDKLPKHTVPVIETVVEDVEDISKKGKFETITETKVIKHKVAWRYHNWFGVLVLCLVTLVATFISGTLGAYVNTDLSLNRTSDYDYTDSKIHNSIYDDSVVCYIDSSSGTASSYYWLVKDEAVYRNIKYCEGYDYWEWTWDETLGAYKMLVTPSEMPSYMESLCKASEDNSSSLKNYTITPSDEASTQVVLTVSGLKDKDVIQVIKDDTVDYSFKFSASANKVEIVLPYGYGDCTLSITSSSSPTITAYEYGTSDNLINNDAADRFETLSSFMKDTYGYDLKFGFVRKG